MSRFQCYCLLFFHFPFIFSFWLTVSLLIIVFDTIQSVFTLILQSTMNHNNQMKIIRNIIKRIIDICKTSLFSKHWNRKQCIGYSLFLRLDAIRIIIFSWSYRKWEKHKFCWKIFHFQWEKLLTSQKLIVHKILLFYIYFPFDIICC